MCEYVCTFVYVYMVQVIQKQQLNFICGMVHMLLMAIVDSEEHTHKMCELPLCIASCASSTSTKSSLCVYMTTSLSMCVHSIMVLLSLQLEW